MRKTKDKFLSLLLALSMSLTYIMGAAPAFAETNLPSYTLELTGDAGADGGTVTVDKDTKITADKITASTNLKNEATLSNYTLDATAYATADELVDALNTKQATLTDGATVSVAIHTSAAVDSEKLVHCTINFTPTTAGTANGGAIEIADGVSAASKPLNLVQAPATGYKFTSWLFLGVQYTTKETLATAIDTARSDGSIVADTTVEAKINTSRDTQACDVVFNPVTDDNGFTSNTRTTISASGSITSSAIDGVKTTGVKSGYTFAKFTFNSTDYTDSAALATAINTYREENDPATLEVTVTTSENVTLYPVTVEFTAQDVGTSDSTVSLLKNVAADATCAPTIADGYQLTKYTIGAAEYTTAESMQAAIDALRATDVGTITVNVYTESTTPVTDWTISFSPATGSQGVTSKVIHVTEDRTSQEAMQAALDEIIADNYIGTEYMISGMVDGASTGESGEDALFVSNEANTLHNHLNATDIKVEITTVKAPVAADVDVTVKGYTSGDATYTSRASFGAKKFTTESTLNAALAIRTGYHAVTYRLDDVGCANLTAVVASINTGRQDGITGFALVVTVERNTACDWDIAFSGSMANTGVSNTTLNLTASEDITKEQIDTAIAGIVDTDNYNVAGYTYVPTKISETTGDEVEDSEHSVSVTTSQELANILNDAHLGMTVKKTLNVYVSVLRSNTYCNANVSFVVSGYNTDPIQTTGALSLATDHAITGDEINTTLAIRTGYSISSIKIGEKTFSSIESLASYINTTRQTTTTNTFSVEVVVLHDEGLIDSAIAVTITGYKEGNADEYYTGRILPGVLLTKDAFMDLLNVRTGYTATAFVLNSTQYTSVDTLLTAINTARTEGVNSFMVATTVTKDPYLVAATIEEVISGYKEAPLIMHSSASINEGVSFTETEFNKMLALRTGYTLQSIVISGQTYTTAADAAAAIDTARLAGTSTFSIATTVSKPHVMQAWKVYFKPASGASGVGTATLDMDASTSVSESSLNSTLGTIIASGFEFKSATVYGKDTDPSNGLYCGTVNKLAEVLNDAHNTADTATEYTVYVEANRTTAPVAATITTIVSGYENSVSTNGYAALSLNETFTTDRLAKIVDLKSGYSITKYSINNKDYTSDSDVCSAIATSRSNGTNAFTIYVTVAKSTTTTTETLVAAATQAVKSWTNYRTGDNGEDGSTISIEETTSLEMNPIVIAGILILAGVLFTAAGLVISKRKTAEKDKKAAEITSTKVEK